MEVLLSRAGFALKAVCAVAQTETAANQAAAASVMSWRGFMRIHSCGLNGS
jgi:hypothetical protein